MVEISKSLQLPTTEQVTVIPKTVTSETVSPDKIKDTTIVEVLKAVKNSIDQSSSNINTSNSLVIELFKDYPILDNLEKYSHNLLKNSLNEIKELNSLLKEDVIEFFSDKKKVVVKFDKNNFIKELLLKTDFKNIFNDREQDLLKIQKYIINEIKSEKSFNNQISNKLLEQATVPIAKDILDFVEKIRNLVDKLDSPLVTANLNNKEYSALDRSSKQISKKADNLPTINKINEFLEKGHVEKKIDNIIKSILDKLDDLPKKDGFKLVSLELSTKVELLGKIEQILNATIDFKNTNLVKSNLLDQVNLLSTLNNDVSENKQLEIKKTISNLAKILLKPLSSEKSRQIKELLKIEFTDNIEKNLSKIDSNTRSSFDLAKNRDSEFKYLPLKLLELFSNQDLNKTNEKLFEKLDVFLKLVNLPNELNLPKDQPDNMAKWLHKRPDNKLIAKLLAEIKTSANFSTQDQQKEGEAFLRVLAELRTSEVRQNIDSGMSFNLPNSQNLSQPIRLKIKREQQGSAKAIRNKWQVNLNFVLQDNQKLSFLAVWENKQLNLMVEASAQSVLDKAQLNMVHLNSRLEKQGIKTFQTEFNLIKEKAVEFSIKSKHSKNKSLLDVRI